MFGRNRPPAAVRARLERDERVLAWGIVGSGHSDLRRAHQTGADEDTGVGETCVGETGPAGTAAVDAGPGVTGSDEARSYETGSDETGADGIGSDEAGADDVGPARVPHAAVTAPDDSAAAGAVPADGERYVVATNVGLWWPDQPPRRIPWHLIVRATWSERGLTIVEADVVDDLLLVERPAQTVALTREGKIPPAVRKRVEGSIATTHDVRLDDGPARLVARRVTGRDGQVWLARLGPQTPDTERSRAQVRALLERFRIEDEARREALLR